MARKKDAEALRSKRIGEQVKRKMPGLERGASGALVVAPCSKGWARFGETHAGDVVTRMLFATHGSDGDPTSFRTEAETFSHVVSRD